MGISGKSLALILILIMAISSLNLLVIKPASGQTSIPTISSVPTPSVPQFTVKLVNTSDLPTIYWLNLSPESTISISTDNNSNYTIELTVKNQPFVAPFIENGQFMALSYDVRLKEHYLENWTDVYALDEWYPVPSNSDYTVIPFPLEVSGEPPASYNIKSCFYGVYYSALNGISVGDQIDFQVETQIGYAHKEVSPYPSPPWLFVGQTSGWSNTQTITISPSSSSTSPPATQWQKLYGSGKTESVSNLIQTSDGGYAFLDCGKSYQQHDFIPSTLFKLDSSGNMQWNKTINLFTASNLIQTSDGGYEIAGEWNTYGIIYQTTEPINQTTPTLIKLNSKGDIQWYENTSSVLNLAVVSSNIQTSDGGFAYFQPANAVLNPPTATFFLPL